ncbi:MAG TPA: hypothetical protein VKP67_28170 [Xanthobacteraceae bacterium]|nr:hypothetical protein [Xanthobacteraceae bacterium]
MMTPLAPIADRFVFSFCGDCPNAHILYFDKDNHPIAQATMSRAQALSIAEAIDNNDPNFK